MITSRGAPAPLFIFTMVIMNGIKFIEPGTISYGKKCN